MQTTKQEPKRLRAATSLSPAASRAPSPVNTAAMPEAVAKGGLCALDQPQPFLEGLDGGVAVAGVDEPVHLAGEGLLRLPADE